MTKHNPGTLPVLLALSCWIASLGANAFMVTIPSTLYSSAASIMIRNRRQHHSGMEKTTTLLFEQDERQKGGAFDFLFNPYGSKIPKEIEKEIYEAEGNTAAAKDRGKRIALYAVICLVGIACAFFNAFLTELRSGPVPEGAIPFNLAESSFAWVQSNVLLRFLFLNKIGGGLALLGGAGAGLLAEAEFDSRRINAEKIWEEMQRRRSGAESKKQKKVQAKKKRKKKRRSGKEAKRLGALSEVIVDDVVEPSATLEVAQTEGLLVEAADNEKAVEKTEAEKKEDGGLFGAIKGFYEKADNMAATQALLLNKKLEDEGLVEKITDETGLKVIGRDEAAKLKANKPDSKDKTERSDN